MPDVGRLGSRFSSWGTGSTSAATPFRSFSLGADLGVNGREKDASAPYGRETAEINYFLAWTLSKAMAGSAPAPELPPERAW